MSHRYLEKQVLPNKSSHLRKYDLSLFTGKVLPMTSGVTKYTLAQYAPFPYYLYLELKEIPI